MKILSYDGRLSDANCLIKGAQDLRLKPFSEVNAFYELKSRFLQSCVVTTVEDVNATPIRYPAEQVGCKIERLAETKIQFTGQLCCFEAGSNSDYLISHALSPECASRKGLIEKDLEALDVPTTINLFLAGDATGLSTDLQALSSYKARFSVDPGHALMRQSEALGEELPRWPALWLPDVHVGGIDATSSGGDDHEFRVNFLVDNTCPRKFVDGLCSSPCNYAVPIAAEASLYDITGRRQFIDSFRQGGTALAQWQGILHSVPHSLKTSDLRVGRKYEMEIVFRDPYEDFYSLSHETRQYLVNLDGFNSAVPGLSGLVGIASFEGLGSLAGLPSLGPVPANIASNEIPALMQRVLDELGESFELSEWPPSYDQFCTKDLARCKKASHGANIAFRVEFVVESVEGLRYRFSGLKVRRQSDILPGYERAITHANMTCGG